MVNQFKVWYYIKDFVYFNKKQNKIYLPEELVKYIFSYLLSNIKYNVNMNYIHYSIKYQMDVLDTKIEKETNIDYCITDEVRIYLKDLPYPVISMNQLYTIIDCLIGFKGYSYKYYKYEGQVIVYEKTRTRK